VNSGRQSSLNLSLSDLEDDEDDDDEDENIDYDSVLGYTPASTGNMNTAKPSEGSSAWTARSASNRNLIELDESGSSIAGSSIAGSSPAIIATADIKGRLQQSRIQFERSITNLKEQQSSPVWIKNVIIPTNLLY